jgi:uncharacterized protein with ParB-like and HNH nuclease domain/predicted transport protein
MRDSMEAKAVNLLSFLQIPKQLFIPKYQRTYRWDLKHCKQLWKDLMNAPDSGYFIGSIVYIKNSGQAISSISKYLVIDGQQRLTTISLLLSALRNKIEETEDLQLSEEKITSKKLNNYYLFNPDEDDNAKYRLSLTKSDKELFLDILEGREVSETETSNLKRNFSFFVDQIEKNDLKKVYEGISKLMIIDVSLDHEKDNPQLIFESLNSTGLDLSQSDLIRNYVLMGLPETEQDKIYFDYWYPMEQEFLSSNQPDLFDFFIRDYLTIKTGKTPAIKGIYESFKDYKVSLKKTGVEEIIKDLRKFSKHYVNFSIENKEEDLDLSEYFKELRVLRVNVAYPFLMEVYEDYVNQKLSKKDFVFVLKLIISYVFRRFICGVPTNSLNKVFSKIHSAIDLEDYIESLAANLVVKDSYSRFPKDEEFFSNLLEKDIYHMRIRNYILDKFENFEHNEKINVEEYTIEHIMPQTVTNEWKKELGDDWKEIYEKYLHRLGNLTITGYNSRYSNSSFKEKRDMEKGFNESHLILNKNLGKLESWNKEEIEKRGRNLAERAKEIWSYPKISLEKLEKYKEETKKAITQYSLNDHLYLGVGSPMNELFYELRKRILNIDSSVREEPLKLYIAYKTLTNFVDIVPQKNALRLSLNLNFDEINDPENKCTNVTNLGRWGNGNSELKISSMKEIDYAMSLISQAYERQVGDE